MHEFIIKIFSFIKHILYFMRLVCVFCILMLLLYWIQNLTHAEWAWLGFIKPFLDCLLAMANQIYSVQFDLWGAVFEFKYLSALIILTLAAYAFKGLDFVVCMVEGLYRGTRMLCKKTELDIFNKQLRETEANEQKKLVRYSVIISTQIKQKFEHQEIGINLEEQNQKMTNFIKEKTAMEPSILNGVFLYQFDNFNNIDNVLDILFKLIKSKAPIEPAISIQVGNDLGQLGKLSELKLYGKVVIAADTAYRYRFNTTHRYKISQIGIFQDGDKTLEVHEFKEIL